MSMVGTDFARSHMEGKGWSCGEGLGRHGQGIVDAIKPKLKFDQAGMGHNRAEEFEFHWWDHVFNKAAKSIKVEDKGGEVLVDFNSDKSELSTKKLRKKAQKEMKNKLYSNFVKSGTLTGGKMEEEDNPESSYVEDKDLSKLKELTDEELVAACGGRTAHKGSRHGHKMQAKLDRIAEAEREYMENFNKKAEEKEKCQLKQIDEMLQERTRGAENQDEAQEVKKKKKKSKRKDEMPKEEPDSKDEEQNVTLETKKKKKSKRARDENESIGDALEPQKKKKHKKQKTEDKECELVVAKKKHKKSKL